MTRCGFININIHQSKRILIVVMGQCYAKSEMSGECFSTLYFTGLLSESYNIFNDLLQM